MKEPGKQKAPFDTDCYKISIDNCWFCYISNNKDDFVPNLIPIDIVIIGIRGRAENFMMGTIKQKVQNDQGYVHVFEIPNVLYQLTILYQLFYP